MLEGDNYRITGANILAHEIIGLGATVKESTDCNKAGISGKIIDETKNLVVIETSKGTKRIAKKEVVLEINIGNEKAIVNGKSLMARPEDRTKINWRKNYA